MGRSTARTVGVLVAAVAVLVGVLVLRAQTISTHTEQHPESRLAVVLQSELEGSETGQTLEEYTRAKILFCRTEVAISDPITDLRPVDGDEDGRFRFVLQPSLDDSDRRQFRGCMEDWNLDHLQVDVQSMQDLGPDGDDDGAS
jgi:hypothetical protein